MDQNETYLEATQESGKALIMRGISGSVVTLNLLRFRDRADDSAAPHLAPQESIRGTAAYHPILLGALLLLLFLTACAPEKALTVSEVWQNAPALEGKQIRVRGQAVFFTVPYQGLTGCVPGGGREIKGELALYDEDAPDPHYYGGTQPLARIEISAESLNCGGNTCRLTCGPFDPRAAKVVEFSGRLHSETRQGEKALVLGELDLGKSSLVTDGALKSISTGTFDIIFP